MLEEILIRYSAPTLAGLKTANLFWYSWESKAEFENSMEVWTRIFEEKGLDIRIMRTTAQRALLYVNRKKQLEADLKREKTRRMLKAEGYDYSSVEEAVKILQNKLQMYETFPHEIGLFLGYPEEDVQGFIENQGKNCKCCGCWKVYCNECDAQKMFCKFKKCERVYERLFLKGRPVEKMIVVA